MKTILRKIGAATGVTILGAGLLVGDNAQAGQNEWATAGKILAGVLAVDVLFNHIPAAVCAQPTVVYTTPVVREYCPPPPVVYETRVVQEYCPPPPVVVYQTRVVREYCPPPVIYYERNYGYAGGGYRHGGWNRPPARPGNYHAESSHRGGPAGRR